MRMTTQFGRTTPMQGNVLHIGGIVCGVPDDLVRDEDRIAAMKTARERLRSKTGRNFGYDIAAWHEFLQESRAFREEYTFHYAWQAVREKVEQLIGDTDRLRLVTLI